MAQAPLIKTERLGLAGFGPEFLTETYVAWLNDPEVVRFSEQRHRRHTLESCRRFMESFVGSPHFFWAITAPMGHIGNITARVDEFNSLADISILIGNRSAWGKGYATEAYLGVMRFLFEELGIRKLTAGTLAGNSAMAKVAQKVGMKPDGRRRRHYLLGGKEEDVIYFACFAQDWPRGPVE